MQHITDLGIILRSKPYQERDRLVTFLSESHGRLTGVAKGAIHSRRFGGSLDLFMCSNIEFVERAGREMVSIRGATIRHEFTNLQADLEKISAAGYFVDLILRLIEEKEPVRPIFMLLTHYLYLLESHPMSMAVARSFEIKLLDRLGTAPVLDKCAISGEEFFWQKQKQVAFSFEHGGVVLDEHANASCMRIFQETLLWFVHAQKSPIRDIPQLKASKRAMLQGAEALQAFLRYHGPGLQNYEFRSHKLLEELLAQ